MTNVIYKNKLTQQIEKTFVKIEVNHNSLLLFFVVEKILVRA